MSLVGSFFFRPAQAQPEDGPSLVVTIRETIQKEKRTASPALSSQELEDSVSTYDHWIKAACRKYSLDPALVKAVIHAESQFDPEAISPKGAIGLMQLHPITARELGVKDPFNPKYNIDGGVRYLRDLLKNFEGDQHLALAAYNAGPARVHRHKGVPPFRDTHNYLARVFRYLAHYQKDRVG
jgi:soluble lytic murein transglycosylase-like protein